MKRIFILLAALVFTTSAKAQFVTFQSVEQAQSQRSYTPSSGYGNPFVTFEAAPIPGVRQAPKEQMREQTLRGYYKEGNKWYSMPIRVGITSDKVILLSYKKGGYSWSNCGNVASMVGGWDSQEITDNFTYKAYSTIGTIYF